VKYAITSFAETANAAGAERVAVGHTADDHIETVLLNLIRGSGTRDCADCNRSESGNIRAIALPLSGPLLPVSREETAAYCRRHHLKPRLDTSNLSLSLLRNRVRQQLLPLLRSYNPQVAGRLAPHVGYRG